MLTKNGTDDKKTQIQLISLDQLVPEDHLLRKIDNISILTLSMIW